MERWPESVVPYTQGYTEVRVTGRDHAQRRDAIARDGGAFIILAGAEHTEHMCQRARIYQKLILPVGSTGGVAAELWRDLQQDSEGRYAYRSALTDDDFHLLNPDGVDDAGSTAEQLLRLLERTLTPTGVSTMLGRPGTPGLTTPSSVQIVADPSRRPGATAYLPHETVFDLIQALVNASQCTPEVRDALLMGISKGFIALLPIKHTPYDQMSSDLNEMNGVYTLADQEIPLLVWLHNAIQRFKLAGFPDEARFRRAAEIVTGQGQLRFPSNQVATDYMVFAQHEPGVLDHAGDAPMTDAAQAIQLSLPTSSPSQHVTAKDGGRVSHVTQATLVAASQEVSASGPGAVVEGVRQTAGKLPSPLTPPQEETRTSQGGADPPRAHSQVHQLQQELSEWQRRYSSHTRRIATLDTDLERARDSELQLSLESRRSQLIAERNAMAAQILALETQLAQFDAAPA